MDQEPVLMVFRLSNIYNTFSLFELNLPVLALGSSVGCVRILTLESPQLLLSHDLPHKVLVDEVRGLLGISILPEIHSSALVLSVSLSLGWLVPCNELPEPVRVVSLQRFLGGELSEVNVPVSLQFKEHVDDEQSDVV